MTTTALPFELDIIEGQREEELEEARAVQCMMLPTEMLHGGSGVSFLGVKPRDEVVREWAKGFPVCIDSNGGLQ